MTDETCCGACGYPVHATKEMACDWCRQAADRIEALIAERDEANKRGDAWRFRADIAEANLTKALEALLWCSGSADFNEGGVAREGWLKVCAPLLKGDSHE